MLCLGRSCQSCIRSPRDVLDQQRRSHLGNTTVLGRKFQQGFILASILTFGEGYHNFHHTDYRNGHKWYHMDPSKWWIQSFKYLGLNSDLKSTPKHSIEIAKVNMRFKKRADRLQRRNVNIHRFEDRLTRCKGKPTRLKCTKFKRPSKR